jgi:hypothetical protein
MKSQISFYSTEEFMENVFVQAAALVFGISSSPVTFLCIL